MNEIEFLVDQTRLVVQRLERISADSTWARRSSGQRGALLRWLDLYQARQLEFPGQPAFSDHEARQLRAAIQTGFRLLEQAARDVA